MQKVETETETTFHADGEEPENIVFEPTRKVADSVAKVSEINEDDRTVVTVISTGVVDRDGEVLVPSGASLENYMKNPVVPWSHNSMDPPIGKALWVKRSASKLTAKVKFALTDRAEEVWQLFKGGYLKAFSVGFLPSETPSSPTPDEIRKNPNWASARRVFRKWELLEFSPVTVPANPEALMLAYKSGTIKMSKASLDMLEMQEEQGDTDDDVLIAVSEFTEPIYAEPFINVEKYVAPKKENNIKRGVDIKDIVDIMNSVKGK